MIKKISIICVGVFLLTSAVSVNAATIWAVGKISRTLSSPDLGGCTIILAKPVTIGEGCPENSTAVSLDCEGVFVDKSVAARNYASAVVAASLGKTVSLRINNEQKHNGYCVANRLDIGF